MIDHNKLIKQVGKSVLNPLGLFQRGNSRMWIDDNGWCLTWLAFDSSAWSKGSHLSVGVSYLWRSSEWLAVDYYRKDWRLCEFVEFTGNEEAFYKEIYSMAELGAKQAIEYRELRDISLAREEICRANVACCPPQVTHQFYNKMMLCGLARHYMTEFYYARWLESLKDAKDEWEMDYLREAEENIRGIIGEPALFHDYVVRKINVSREAWRAKPSMKKLSADPFLG